MLPLSNKALLEQDKHTQRMQIEHLKAGADQRRKDELHGYAMGTAGAGLEAIHGKNRMNATNAQQMHQMKMRQADQAHQQKMKHKDHGQDTKTSMSVAKHNQAMGFETGTLSVPPLPSSVYNPGNATGGNQSMSTYGASQGSFDVPGPAMPDRVPMPNGSFNYGGADTPYDDVHHYNHGTTHSGMPMPANPEAGPSDTVPAMLTPGEAVIPREAAQDPRLKPVVKQLINHGRNVQRMQRGGTVPPMAYSQGTWGVPGYELGTDGIGQALEAVAEPSAADIALEEENKRKLAAQQAAAQVVAQPQVPEPPAPVPRTPAPVNLRAVDNEVLKKAAALPAVQPPPPQGGGAAFGVAPSQGRRWQEPKPDASLPSSLEQLAGQAPRDAAPQTAAPTTPAQVRQRQVPAVPSVTPAPTVSGPAEVPPSPAPVSVADQISLMETGGKPMGYHYQLDKDGNRVSSASGLGGFIDSTAQHELNILNKAEGTKYTLEDHRNNVDNLQKRLLDQHVKANTAILEKKGLPTNFANVYAMQFFGQTGGPKFAELPGDAKVESILSEKELKANPSLRGKTKDQLVAEWDRRANQRSKTGPVRTGDTTSTTPAPQAVAGPGVDVAVAPVSPVNSAEPPKPTEQVLVDDSQAARDARLKDEKKLARAAADAATKVAPPKEDTEFGWAGAFKPALEAVAGLFGFKDAEVRKLAGIAAASKMLGYSTRGSLRTAFKYAEASAQTREKREAEVTKELRVEQMRIAAEERKDIRQGIRDDSTASKKLTGELESKRVEKLNKDLEAFEEGHRSKGLPEEQVRALGQQWLNARTEEHNHNLSVAEIQQQKYNELIKAKVDPLIAKREARQAAIAYDEEHRPKLKAAPLSASGFLSKGETIKLPQNVVVKTEGKPDVTIPAGRFHIQENGKGEKFVMVNGNKVPLASFNGMAAASNVTPVMAKPLTQAELYDHEDKLTERLAKVFNESVVKDKDGNPPSALQGLSRTNQGAELIQHYSRLGWDISDPDIMRKIQLLGARAMELTVLEGASSKDRITTIIPQLKAAEFMQTVDAMGKGDSQHFLGGNGKPMTPQRVQETERKLEEVLKKENPRLKDEKIDKAVRDAELNKLKREEFNKARTNGAKQEASSTASGLFIYLDNDLSKRLKSK